MNQKGQALVETTVVGLGLIATTSVFVYLGIIKWQMFAIEQSLYQGVLCLADHKQTTGKCLLKANHKLSKLSFIKSKVRFNFSINSEQYIGNYLWNLTVFTKTYPIKKEIIIYKQDVYPAKGSNILRHLKDLSM